MIILASQEIKEIEYRNIMKYSENYLVQGEFVILHVFITSKTSQKHIHAYNKMVVSKQKWNVKLRKLPGIINMITVLYNTLYCIQKCITYNMKYKAVDC